MRRPRGQWGWAGRVLGLGVIAGLVAPLPVARADERAAQARQACLAGRVDEGVELLATLYAQSGDANAIYNQARCYQQNGRPEQAMARFREYLRVNTAVDPQERAQIDQYLRELEVELEARSRRELAARFPPPVPAPPVVVADTAAAPAPLPPPAPAADLEDQSGGSRLGAVAFTTAAVGLVAVGAGAFFGWRAARIERDIEGQAGPVPARDFQQRYDRGVTAQKLQWVGYGLGAAALAASTALFLVRF